MHRQPTHKDSTNRPEKWCVLALLFFLFNTAVSDICHFSRHTHNNHGFPGSLHTHGHINPAHHDGDRATLPAPPRVRPLPESAREGHCPVCLTGFTDGMRRRILPLEKIQDPPVLVSSGILSRPYISKNIRIPFHRGPPASG